MVDPEMPPNLGLSSPASTLSPVSIGDGSPGGVKFGIGSNTAPRLLQTPAVVTLP